MVATEWYRIFSMTVPSTWIVFVLAALLTGLILYVKFGKEASSQFGDMIFHFIIIWKLSVVITDFSNIIQYPWMILYFSGGRTGVYIGVVGLILHMLYRVLRKKPFLSKDILTCAFISFYSSYAVIVVFMNQSSILDIVLVLFVFIFMGWLMLSYKEFKHWILLFLLVYAALHIILQGNFISTSMITASIFSIVLLQRVRIINLVISCLL